MAIWVSSIELPTLFDPCRVIRFGRWSSGAHRGTKEPSWEQLLQLALLRSQPRINVNPKRLLKRGRYHLSIKSWLWGNTTLINHGLCFFFGLTLQNLEITGSLACQFQAIFRSSVRRCQDHRFVTVLWVAAAICSQDSSENPRPDFQGKKRASDFTSWSCWILLDRGSSISWVLGVLSSSGHQSFFWFPFQLLLKAAAGPLHVDAPTLKRRTKIPLWQTHGNPSISHPHNWIELVFTIGISP